MHTKTDVLITALVLTLFFPFSVLSSAMGPSRAVTDALFAQGQPFQQEVIVTAYYSPLPDQCCYVKGDYFADMVLNGEGHHGADGTAVYPGMIAAPPSYPFGTRVTMPGIGIGTVHDRGGAIQEWKNAHRLDLWVGHGEEGLARALAFGVQRFTATVYPPSAEKPAEGMNLAELPAPPERLRPYLAEGTTLFSIRAKLGDRTASVQFLQARLKELGYFDDKPSGFFGPATQQSLHAFYQDMGVAEPDDQLTESGAAFLEAAFARVSAADPIKAIVDKGSSPARIAEAQRTLRFLGFYSGRTNGQYDEMFTKAVLTFQKQQGIIASESTAGAGRIGPQTRQRVITLWRGKHVTMSAQRLLAMRRIDRILADRGFDLQTYLSKGDRGAAVRTLQNFLIAKGYLKDTATGSFGEKTEEALIAYQRATGIIADDSDTGAGYAGPATLARFRTDMKKTLLQTVRAQGWNAI